MRKYHTHTKVRTPDMHPKVAGYEEVDTITGDHHITTIIDECECPPLTQEEIKELHDRLLEASKKQVSRIELMKAMYEFISGDLKGAIKKQESELTEIARAAQEWNNEHTCPICGGWL